MNSEDKSIINAQLPKENIQQERAAKKRTLKQLEEDLAHYKSIINKCVAAVDEDNFHMSFSNKHNKSCTYEDIQMLTLDERYSSALRLINNKDFFDGELEHENVHKAVRVLYLLGFRDLAVAVHKMGIDYSISKFYQPKIESIQEQIKHKKMTSKGGKGRTSRHKDIALQIAKKTWHKTPGASMSSLSKKIHAYLDHKHTDVPETETIAKWLKDSGLNPNISPKIRNYNLVV